MPSMDAMLESPQEGLDAREEDAESASVRRDLRQTVISDTLTNQFNAHSEYQDTDDSDMTRKKRARQHLEADDKPDDVGLPTESPKQPRKDCDQATEPEKKRPRDSTENSPDSATPPEQSDKKRPRNEDEKKLPDDNVSKSQHNSQPETEPQQSDRKSPQDYTTAEEDKDKDADEKNPVYAACESSTDKDTDEIENARSCEPDVTKSPSAKPSPAKLAPAFENSAFGKLSTAASPFATVGALGQKSVLGGAAEKLVADDKATLPPATLKLGFSNTSSQSPFTGAGQLSKNGVGINSPALVGFGGLASLKQGQPLFGFGKPGEALKLDKLAKPFGAPDGDPENEVEEDPDEAEPNGKEADKSTEGDDEKRKFRLQKVEVDDGEAGEATLLSVRVKLYHLDKSDGWKERGAGMLKINVPEVCVEFNGAGQPIAGSFDASELDDDEKGSKALKGNRVARLVMRQDQTLRVILNTAILPYMQFIEKASLKFVTILFTAFEGSDASPVSITLRMSAVSAKNFIAEIESIQRELRGV